MTLCEVDVFFFSPFLSFSCVRVQVGDRVPLYTHAPDQLIHTIRVSHPPTPHPLPPSLTYNPLSPRHSQLLFYTQDPDLAHSLTKAFTYLLPLGGILGIPFVGFLLDKRSIRDAILVLAILGVLFGALGMTSAASAQIVSIAMLTILRPLMYTAVSDFSAK